MAGGLRNYFRGFRLMARVRWLSLLLPAIVLACALIGYVPSAGAQSYRCTSPAAACDQGEANAEAWAYANDTAGRQGAGYVPCVEPSASIFVAAAYSGYCGSGYRVGTQSFYWKGECAARPDWNGPYPYLSGGKPKNGSVSCNAGCKQAWYSTGDGYFNGKYTSVPGTCNDYNEDKCKAQFGGGYSWNQGLSSCEPDDGKCPDGKATNSLGQCAPEPCPAGKVQQADGTCKNKENECPAGQIKSPDGKCLPGDGQCAEGEARGKDGTCKKDSDGDGEPDPGEDGEGPDGEKGKESFSGGDDCKSPPSCSGSPIMCGQARIQWRIDCNTRRNRNIAGGLCSTPPVCTGDKCDALEYSGLLMQWRSACALEKLASGSGNGSNADLTAIRAALTGTNGNPNYGAESPGSGAWQNGGNTPPGKPNTAGYGWSGSCPQPPSFDVMGQSFQFNVTPLCNWLSLGSYFVLGLAALFSLKIVASKDA